MDASNSKSPSSVASQCDRCGSVPRPMLQLLGPRTGRTISLYECQCGATSLGKLARLLATVFIQPAERAILVEWDALTPFERHASERLLDLAQDEEAEEDMSEAEARTLH